MCFNFWSQNSLFFPPLTIPCWLLHYLNYQTPLKDCTVKGSVVVCVVTATDTITEELPMEYKLLWIRILITLLKTALLNCFSRHNVISVVAYMQLPCYF